MKTTKTTIAIGLLLAFGAISPVFSQVEPLALRINDMTAVPGGRVAVVLRTYESRPIGQGQVCLRINRRAFASAESALVTSGAGDAIHRIQPLDSRTFLLQFTSPTASINDSDGPLAVLYFRIRDSISPGQVFSLSIDLFDSFLTDAAGEPIVIDQTPGELTIRAPSTPMQVAADGDRIAPGQMASVFLETMEPLSLTSGSMGLRYDTAVTIGAPSVRIGPNYGNASFLVDDSVPGLIVVTFDSPDASFGRIPGGLIQVDLETDPGVPPGTLSPISLDPSWTILVGPRGQVPILLEPGEIEFE